MSDVENLHELYVAQLKDIYYAEKQLVKALPKMAEKATNAQLRDAFLSHLDETETHVERLEEVFELLDIAARAEKCPAILGIIDEAKEIIDECEDGVTLDAGLIMGGQKAEHYEIATYGTLIAWAETMGHREQAEILKKTLSEEKAANDKLTQLATTSINKAANTNTDSQSKQAA
jgi:ferritin-like metal-binding protein YciE